MNDTQKTSNRFKIAVAIAIALSCTSALAHGWLDGRWGNQPDLVQRAAQLQQLPDTIGDWVLLEERELADNAASMLRCYGYNHTVYQNTRTGKSITMAVLFGPRGPIAVHTPEICYSGQGVQSAGGRSRVVIDGKKPQTIWKVSFLSKVDAQPELDVYYAWSDGGPWQAAEQPRFWLTEDLYKIQIAGPPAVAGEPSECEQFLEQLFPLLAPLIKKQS
jgi:hypothetical protein